MCFLIPWRSCHNGVITHTSRPCYSICIEIFSDVFLPICFWWKQSLLNWIYKLDTCTHRVMPASIEMLNYDFHQISSFCCFNVLMFYAVIITGGTYRPLVTPSWQDRRTFHKHSHMRIPSVSLISLSSNSLNSLTHTHFWKILVTVLLKTYDSLSGTLRASYCL